MAFFCMLLTFYGLPIHIMRDLFMTARSFFKRLGALLRYRRAIQDMNRYPDATEEELGREDTCIICREEMRPWDPSNNPGAVERSRPKKLPCGHILHFGCLKSWLERQQVCPTCRSPVIAPNNGAAENRDGLFAQMGINVRFNPPANDQGQQPPQNGAGADAQDAQQPPANQGGMRVFNLGPVRLGFQQGEVQNVQDLARGLGLPAGNANPPNQATAPRSEQQPAGSNLPNIRAQIQELDQLIQREMQSLQYMQHELQTVNLLATELSRLRRVQQQHEQASVVGQGTATPSPVSLQPPQQTIPQPLQLPHAQFPLIPQLAPFSTFPPRLNSPSITRHGSSLHSTSIPAGSPDLPEGVVIPPGWSLLPLQRMDGVQVAPNIGSSGQAVPHVSMENGTVLQPTQSIVVEQQPRAGATLPEETNGVSAIAHESSISGIVGRSSTSSPASNAATISSSFVNTQPAEVVAPSPVMPNWGGSAQMFGRGNELDPLNATSQSRATRAQHASSTSSEEDDEDDEEEEEDEDGDDEDDEPVSRNAAASSSKGKGKAVTIEEAAEDDDDED
jgi:E3 ubiquitin-protein ligase synoviolin